MNRSRPNATRRTKARLKPPSPPHRSNMIDLFLHAASSSSHQRGADTLPFHAYDFTAGTENEYQAVVMGSSDHVDLPLSLTSSNFFKNTVGQAAARQPHAPNETELERFVHNTSSTIWENSWVRFPLRYLSQFSMQVLQHDLLADKKRPTGPQRQDVYRFLFSHEGEDWLRVPISYLLRLALADVVSCHQDIPPLVRRVGEQLMEHYLNDNTSPETYSFYVTKLSPDTGMGREVGREAAKRFLLSQLLTMYANRTFGLLDRGQRALIYFAPHPPIRQKSLNRLISDSFYRELFMNPCLSGWDSGEEKHDYMALCHEVLSRSHMNAITQLQHAGILTRNLMTLPTPSNISLANNGTHLSLGSRQLSQLLQQDDSGVMVVGEKYVGDLVIKIVEHFLPLFVGTYSAAPYRLDFWDFHPEQVLGFLAHELDHTYLQLLWQRWKRKAGLNVFGNPVTPIGPQWLDRLISHTCGLRGDFIPDFRLIDYLVVLPSTEQCPALDGTLGNDVRLKRDLRQLGIYDERMSLYLLYKLRTSATHGFSGFEGRYYSVFESLMTDLPEAANLQALLTALAYRYVHRFEVTHAHIPDTPAIESERRQLFFGAALNIPTYYVAANSQNQFLRQIVARARHVRMSRRFPTFIRIHQTEYRQALLSLLKEDAQDLIEQFGLGDFLERLEDRLSHPETASAFGKLTKGIQDHANVSSPMSLSGEECNTAAEAYYRTTLRQRHLEEGLACLKEDFKRIDAGSHPSQDTVHRVVRALIREPLSAEAFLDTLMPEILEDRIAVESLTRLIHITLMTIHQDIEANQDTPPPTPAHVPHCASIH